MIKKDYKKTEIGIIPEDWEVVKLNDILKIGSGKDYKHLEKGNIPVYGTGGFMLFVNKSLYNGESVCIGRKGTIDKPMFLTGKFWTVDTLFYTHLFKGIKPKFLYYSFLQIDWRKYNEASGVPSLSKKTIEVIKIPLPPLKEQEKIVDILSTADEKIDIIALQITKTEELKKGLLQKLLSEGIGHTEFKNSELGKIPKNWEVVKLEDLSKITMGQSPKSDTYNTDNIGMPLIQGNADCKNRKTKPKIYTTDLTKECFIGDIIMTVRAPVGAISKSLHNACIGRGVCSIKPNEDNEYIYHCLVAYEDNWDKLSQGSTFTAVSRSDIKNLKIPLPPLKEQKEIADILSTVDEKLEVLRAKKEKYKTLKIGLLQKLLSGKLRV